MVKPVLGEKAPMSPVMSMSNEQWNEKCSKLESELAIAQQKVDERENALKNVANSLIQLGMGATQMSATLNNISQQIIQIIQPPAPPQQATLPPNNKAN
jgi:hypothetical protein